MNQYCHYCAFAIEGDCYYCTAHDRVLSENALKRVNKCADYAESELGSIITGKRYTPRERAEKLDNMSLWEDKAWT